jgi:hypothetical protein
MLDLKQRDYLLMPPPSTRADGSPLPNAHKSQQSSATINEITTPTSLPNMNPFSNQNSASNSNAKLQPQISFNQRPSPPTINNHGLESNKNNLFQHPQFAHLGVPGVHSSNVGGVQTLTRDLSRVSLVGGARKSPSNGNNGTPVSSKTYDALPGSPMILSP